MDMIKLGLLVLLCFVEWKGVVLGLTSLSTMENHLINHRQERINTYGVTFTQADLTKLAELDLTGHVVSSSTDYESLTNCPWGADDEMEYGGSPDTPSTGVDDFCKNFPSYVSCSNGAATLSWIGSNNPPHWGPIGPQIGTYRFIGEDFIVYYEEEPPLNIIDFRCRSQNRFFPPLVALQLVDINALHFMGIFDGEYLRKSPETNRIVLVRTYESVVPGESSLIENVTMVRAYLGGRPGYDWPDTVIWNATYATETITDNDGDYPLVEYVMYFEFTVIPAEQPSSSSQNVSDENEEASRSSSSSNRSSLRLWI